MIIIGDVHGKILQYLKILDKNEDKNTVQIGDMGFNYAKIVEWQAYHFNFQETSHVFFKGNHDNYDQPCYYDLGDFGEYKFTNGESFFFIRGAYSIDQHLRYEGHSWWRNEELNWEQANKCIEEYERTKPSIVLSHDCPSFIFNYTSFTSTLLMNLWEIHQPEIWVFGHHHCSLTKNIERTKFKCLNELETFEI